MKILPRIFWVFIIFLFIVELVIFRQAISYHTLDNNPVKLLATTQPAPVNRYVSFSTQLQTVAPMVIKAPGYAIQVFQNPQNPEVFIYDFKNPSSPPFTDRQRPFIIEGRLLKLKDAPFAADVRSHFSADGKDPLYALLVNVKPQKSIFYLYLTAILLTMILLGLSPFLGKTTRKKPS